MACDRKTGPILITRALQGSGRLSVFSDLLFVLIACMNNTCLNLEDIYLEFIPSSRVEAACSRRVSRDTYIYIYIARGVTTAARDCPSPLQRYTNPGNRSSTICFPHQIVSDGK